MLRDKKAETKLTIRGFTGSALQHAIREHLRIHLLDPTNKYALSRCSDLTRSQHIRLISDVAHPPQNPAATSTALSSSETDEISGHDAHTVCTVIDSADSADEQRQAIKEREPHRMAWTLGTTVEIFLSNDTNNTNSPWHSATVIQIAGDLITVHYTQSQIRVDRYNTAAIRSTSQFISERTAWTTGSLLEVYSRKDGSWCAGAVEEIMVAGKQPTTEILRVRYTMHSGAESAKYMQRWAAELRRIPDFQATTRHVYCFDPAKHVALMQSAEPDRAA